MVKGLYDGYPRRYGKSSKVVYDKKEFLNLVNRDNCHKDVYVSVFYYTNLREEGNVYKIDSDSAIIDKIFMDMDFKDWYSFEKEKLEKFKDNIYNLTKNKIIDVKKRLVIKKIRNNKKKGVKNNLTEREKGILIDIYRKIYKKKAEKRLYSKVLELEKKLDKKKVLRVWSFSGGGFHLYVYIKNKPENKKSFYKNVLQFLNDLVMEEKEYYIDEDGNKKLRTLWDPSCPPKLSQIVRVIGTYNTKRKKFCISLTKEDIRKGIEHIKKKAEKQETKIHYLGNTIMELDKSYDTKINYNTCNVTLEIGEDNKCSDIKELLYSYGILWEEIPLCMKRFLVKKNQNLSYPERFVFITFLYRIGLSRNEIVNVLRLVLSPKKLYHCSGESKNNYRPCGIERSRVENQITYIIDNDYFISCSRIREYGLCHPLCTLKDVLCYYY